MKMEHLIWGPMASCCIGQRGLERAVGERPVYSGVPSTYHTAPRALTLKQLTSWEKNYVSCKGVKCLPHGPLADR